MIRFSVINVLRNFVATERGETALSVEVGRLRGQPDQPGRAGERGPYLSGDSGGYSTATAVGRATVPKPPKVVPPLGGASNVTRARQSGCKLHGKAVHRIQQTGARC